MNFQWIKMLLPRGLYGRAALILVVPVISLQIAVSIMFLQRHFEDVTQQLTTSMSIDLRYYVAEVARAGAEAAANVAADLGIVVEPEGRVPTHNSRLFYDLSGIVVVATLRDQVPGIGIIDLASNDKFVLLEVATDAGPQTLQFSRRRVSASNPHQLFVLMIFTGILMTGVAYLFLRNQLRPIRRLAQVAEAFGKGRSEPYRVTGSLEVRSAGRAFLDMRSRIERQIEQRTMMLSGVSHDLRTPLTRMKLGLNMLEQSDERDDLLRDVSEMESLLNTFLDFARSDALDDPVRADTLSLAKRVIEDACRMGGDATLVAPDEVPMVDLRPNAIHRALSNLVSNALSYGTKCQLSITVTDRALRLSVEDNGPGIAPEDREDAMRPFIRLDKSRNQDKGGGVGLGLAIANDIAKGHGGMLHLSKSKALGGLRVDMMIAR
ncbi:MAG: two-component system osmolarity sensor histidine kinase EnvZ [Paracoccaceae bacterium]|jgi:two-component system osmolarity sensor histidine kinase EnvZ